MKDDRIEPEVLVPISYFGCATYFRDSVESVLRQSHQNLRVVIVNDGDSEPPWSLIEDIEDPRVWRIELPTNEGVYFVVSAVLLANDSPLMLIQDADDWSRPERVSVLLDVLRRTDVGAAFSAQSVHYEHGRHYGDGSERATRLEDMSENLCAPADPDTLRQYCQHHGLFRTELLRRLGGYYGGFRVSYDKLIVAVTHLLGEAAYTRAPVYHRLRRPGSLSTAPETRSGSDYRVGVNTWLRKIYSSVASDLDGADKKNADISALMRQFIEPADWARLQAYAADIRGVMHCPSDQVHHVAVRG
ncbi:glycosyltransferase family A protein [Streptomyces sp. NPDC060184]|uniref:glycosyltransferase family A protein n=1 Tax=Streptomyces sp. NPDC060184 TaxID=3347064 RepID=UPI0036597BD3